MRAMTPARSTSAGSISTRALPVGSHGGVKHSGRGPQSRRQRLGTDRAIESGDGKGERPLAGDMRDDGGHCVSVPAAASPACAIPIAIRSRTCRRRARRR